MSQVSVFKQNARRSSQSLWGRVALTVVQVALGTVCGVGAFVGVTLALSGTPESLGEYVRLARVETWPEIKDGVPALIPLPASAPRSGAPTAGLAHGMPEPTAAASDPLSLPVPDPPSAQPILIEPVATPGASALTAASAEVAEAGDASVPARSPDPSIETRVEAEFSSLKQNEAMLHAPALTQQPPAPAAATPETRPAQKRGVMKPHSSNRQHAAGASAASVPPRSNAASMENQPKQAETAARGRPPEVRRASNATADRSSTKRAADAPKTRPDRRDGNSTRPARTRIVEATAPASPESTPAVPGQPEAKEERVHLLGVPLPTGRQIRECLLELRC
jgi:hypothetical protein